MAVLTPKEQLELLINEIKHSNEQNDRNHPISHLPTEQEQPTPALVNNNGDIVSKLTIKYIEQQFLKNLRLMPSDQIKSILTDFITRYTIDEPKIMKDHATVRDTLCCIRMTWYKIMRYETRPSDNPYLDLAALIGSLIHIYFQINIPHLSDEKLIKINELPYPIWGKYDMLLNEHVIVELKTVATLPAKYNPKHMQQLLIYAFVMREYFGYNINLAQLVYISRGRLKTRIFNQQIHEELIEKIKHYLIDYLTELKTYVDAKKPPPFDNKFIKSEDCKYCPYKQYCKA